MHINKNKLEEYNSQSVKILTREMNNLINNEIISSFDLLFLLKEKYVDNFNIINNLKLDYSKLRVNCIYLTNKLKNIAIKNNIKTYFIYYQANGLSTKSGDKLIKKGHVSLLYISKRKQKVFYTIFDPGMQINKPLQFYDRKNYDENNAHIFYNGHHKYPYTFIMNNYIYLNKSKFKISLRFNPDYTYKNQKVFDNKIYHIMTGYKVLSYKNKCYIKLLPINKKLTFGIDNNHYEITYDEILRMNKKILTNKLSIYLNALKLNNSFIDLIMFMIIHDKEFCDNVINKDVIKEYKNGNYL